MKTNNLNGRRRNHIMAALSFLTTSFVQVFAQEDEDDVYDLSPFTITSEEDTGYAATSTLAGTRLKSDLKDLAGPIQVVTEEFLEDTAVTSTEDLFLYTMSTEASGPDGNYGGGGARYLIDEMNRGAVGAMPAAEITDIHVKMWDAYQSGREREARQLYMKTLPLLIIQFLYRMRLTKHVLTQRGIFKNDYVRAPLPEFDEFDHTELNVQLESLSDHFQIAPLNPMNFRSAN